MAINETHDPNLRSWVESANDPGTDFPIQNLPFVQFSLDKYQAPTAGVVIGDSVLDLDAWWKARLDHDDPESGYFAAVNWTGWGPLAGTHERTKLRKITLIPSDDVPELSRLR